jgi:SAM-dependent methyltransferase
MSHEHLREPENFIVEYGHLVCPGADVLDVAAGAGRHASYFFQRGCRVFAIERDPEHVERLRQLGIESVEGDVEKTNLLPEKFDAVINTFFLCRHLLRQYSATLRPNGLLFFRTFTTAHMEILGRTKPRREFLLEPGELRRAFGDLKVIHYAEALEPDRAIGTIVAQKQAVMTE